MNLPAFPEEPLNDPADSSHGAEAGLSLPQTNACSSKRGSGFASPVFDQPSAEQPPQAVVQRFSDPALLQALEREDLEQPWAQTRQAFDLAADLMYLDGNSLGPMTHASAAAMESALKQQWARGLIRSWNSADWISLPQRAGSLLAPLLGVEAEEVVACDSTSINLFKTLAAALALQPQRRCIVAEADAFPTDLYMIDGLRQLLKQGHELRLIPAGAGPEQVASLLDDSVALLVLGHVNYRTGALWPMAKLNHLAHQVGALSLWDVAHSAGALPLQLKADGADFAVGCTYKYLNGGPGAPAFIWVHPRWSQQSAQPLSGWMGHAAPFAFSPDYQRGQGIQHYLCGTPPVLALSALCPALELFQGVDLNALRARSLRLSRLFRQLLSQWQSQLQWLSPEDDDCRGSQVGFAFEHGFALMQALIAHQVIGDFRAPNLVRFGFAPLYVRPSEVARAAWITHQIIRTKAYLEPQYQVQQQVT